MFPKTLKRILIIEPCYQNFGGYFRAINLCRALSRHQISVDLISPSSQKFNLKINFRQENPYLRLIELPRIDLSFYFNLRILRGFISTFIGVFGKYDLIQASVPTQPESIIPAFLLKLLGKKVVIDWDDILADGEIKNPLINKYLIFLEKNCPRIFPNYIVTSQLLQKLAIQRGTKKTHILINGVNTSQFQIVDQITSRQKLKLDKNCKYLISFGNTYSEDRAFKLLKTFEFIYHQDPKIKLIISFNPQTIVNFKKFSLKLDKNIFNNIIVSGYITPDRISFYLGASNAVLFLFGNNLNEKACFPIRIGTYINSEKLIFINDNNSITTRLLKKYSAAIVEKDIKVLAQKAVDYLNHPQKYSSYISNIKSAKQQLSWNTIIIPLINFYQKII